jgi:hypothetical protein
MISTSAVLITSSLLTSSASASMMRSPISQSARPGDAQARSVSQFVTMLKPYVSRGADGVITLAPPTSVAHRVRADWLAAVQHQIAVLDKKIRDGQLRSTAGGRIYDPRNDTFEIQSGWTGGPYNTWWGQYWYIDSTTVNRIEGIWAVGGGVTELAAALFGMLSDPFGAAAVAGYLIVVGALAYCNAAGLGVIIYESWAGPMWCGSQ